MPTADEVLREVGVTVAWMDNNYLRKLADRCAAAETRLAEVERERVDDAVDRAFALAGAKRERYALRVKVAEEQDHAFDLGEKIDALQAEVGLLSIKLNNAMDARWHRMDTEDAVTGGRSLSEVCESERMLRAEVERAAAQERADHQRIVGEQLEYWTVKLAAIERERDALLAEAALRTDPALSRLAEVRRSLQVTGEALDNMSDKLTEVERERDELRAEVQAALVREQEATHEAHVLRAEVDGYKLSFETLADNIERLRAEVKALRGVLRKLRCPKCGDEPGEDGGLWVDDGTPSNIVRCRSCWWRVSPAEVEALRADRERIEWYFGFSPAKSPVFLLTYLQGMREKWSVDRWRAAIDAARAAEADDGKA